jgi:hypothetical protein
MVVSELVFEWKAHCLSLRCYNYCVHDYYFLSHDGVMKFSRGVMSDCRVQGVDHNRREAFFRICLQTARVKLSKQNTAKASVVHSTPALSIKGENQQQPWSPLVALCRPETTEHAVQSSVYSFCGSEHIYSLSWLSAKIFDWLQTWDDRKSHGIPNLRHPHAACNRSQCTGPTRRLDNPRWQ